MKAGRSGSANRDRVTDWPQYLLTNVPEDIRKALSEEREKNLVAISDVVRTILCARYRIHCPAESYRYDLGRDEGARNLLLRMPPKLFRAIEREKERTGKSKRSIILDTLEAHYTKGEK